jgi:hypothetical protein
MILLSISAGSIHFVEAYTHMNSAGSNHFCFMELRKGSLQLGLPHCYGVERLPECTTRKEHHQRWAQGYLFKKWSFGIGEE